MNLSVRIGPKASSFWQMVKHWPVHTKQRLLRPITLALIALMQSQHLVLIHGQMRVILVI